VGGRKYDPKVYVAMKEQVNPDTGKPYTLREIGMALGVDEASVRRGLAKAGWKPYLVPSNVVHSIQTAVERPMVLDTSALGAGAITADWHHPLTDYGLVNVFIEQARELRATNYLVVAGDWFNVDALSSFDHKQASADLDTEFLGSTATMETLLSTFKRLIFSWGNHDARMHKALGYKVSFTKAMKMMFEDLDPKLMDRVSFTNLDHIYIDTPARGRYMVAHPKTYSSIPLSSARKLASKHLTHVLTGHSHHTALGYDPSGRFVVGELGGFFSADHVEYLQRTTNFPNWTNGYGFLSKDGHLSMESPGWSNFIHAKRLG
jgi:hypothetical protein